MCDTSLVLQLVLDNTSLPDMATLRNVRVANSGIRELVDMSPLVWKRAARLDPRLLLKGDVVQFMGLPRRVVSKLAVSKVKFLGGGRQAHLIGPDVALVAALEYHGGLKQMMRRIRNTRKFTI